MKFSRWKKRRLKIEVRAPSSSSSFLPRITVSHAIVKPRTTFAFASLSLSPPLSFDIGSTPRLSTRVDWFDEKKKEKERERERGVVEESRIIRCYVSFREKTRERARINNGESALRVGPGQKLALDSIHDPSSKERDGEET